MAIRVVCVVSVYVCFLWGDESDERHTLSLSFNILFFSFPLDHPQPTVDIIKFFRYRLFLLVTVTDRKFQFRFRLLSK
jgi:hypothetical protein